MTMFFNLEKFGWKVKIADRFSFFAIRLLDSLI